MKFSFTRAACLLPLVLLSGCFLHKQQAQNQQPPLAPPVDDGPVTKPDSAPKDLPPTVISQPEPAKPAPTTTDTASTQEEPKPTPKHKKPVQKPASQANTNTSTTTQPTQQASSGGPEVPAIGQLSTGDSGDTRTRTVNTLDNTERGLNGINRKLNSQEEKISSQIREYIKQARTALNSNDLDGAQTLATKAKLLLDELKQ